MYDLSRELRPEQMSGLAERVLAGDRAAEAQLLQHFSPRIYALLCARTRDREASRDLLQDTLIAVLRALRQGQLREPDKLGAFILGIARNVAQSFIRDGARKREAPLADEPRVPAQDFLEEDERKRHVNQALAELDPIDRQILKMTLVDGHKSGLISKMLGLSPDVVRQRKSRATRKVAEYVRNLAQKRSQNSTGPRHG
jgi:RNA polymerase sigma-70 factor (ECF subfamily)